MLPKVNRLTRKEIEAIKAQAPQVIQGKYFGLIFRPSVKESKFGVIISTKIAKKAVERNRIKRQLFLAIEKTLLDKKGWFLFLAKKTSSEGGPADFEKELISFKNLLD